MIDEKVHYNNNALLKKAGIDEKFTLDHVLEIEKCLNDISYFIKNYVYIISLDERSSVV